MGVVIEQVVEPDGALVETSRIVDLPPTNGHPRGFEELRK
jgi:hypothetical protein